MSPAQRRLALTFLWMLATFFGLLSLLFLIMAYQVINSDSAFWIALFLVSVGFLHQLLVKVIPGARRLFS